MARKLQFTFILLISMVSVASARDFPSYYPAQGFQRTGTIEAAYLDEHRLVIGDVSYSLSKSVVVHSLQSFSVSRARLIRGTVVAFRLGGAREITEVWLLPASYDRSKRR